MVSLLDMTVTLPIEKRENTKKINLGEVIPAIVYGPKQTPVSVLIKRKEFEKVFKTAGESTVINLTGLAKPISTLVKEVDFAPIKGGIIHVDFYALEKGKEVETHVPLHFIGEAPASKLGAVINKVLHEVAVTCLMEDLPAHLEVDLSTLVEVEAKLTIADIKCPKGVKIEAELTDVVALAEAVAEEKEPETTVEITDIPVEQKGKTEKESEA